MTVAHGEGEAADRVPAVDPFDPVALEARLAAARLRRRVALARRPAVVGDVRPPAPARRAAPPHRFDRLLGRVGERPAAVASFALGLAVAVLLGILVSARSTGPAPMTAVAPAKVTVGSAPALARLVARPAALAQVEPPAPRPVALAGGSPGSTVVRSARNSPRATTPPQAVRYLVRDINAATLGRTAKALGVRERVAVPGLPLAVTLDRRGLRVIERRVRGRR